MTPPRLLLVDDDPIVRLVVGEALRAEGFDVAEATTGDEAIVRLEEVKPGVVLLDVGLPDRSGFDVCAQMRSLPSGRTLPIVMLTGQDDLDSVRRAYEVGATDFVSKPIRGLVLAHRLRYMLRAGRVVEALDRSRERLAEAQRLARIGNWECDFERGVFDASDQLRSMLGLDADTPGGALRAIRKLLPADDRPAFADAFRRVLDGECEQVEHELVFTDDRAFHLHIERSPDEGRVVRGTVQDITAARQAREEISRLAYNDVLTGLPNRAHLRRALEAALQDGPGSPFAVVCIDLDHFKRINDTLGHGAGDELLCEAARRIQRCVREHDFVGRPRDDVIDGSVVRMGGDEFVILLPRVPDADTACMVAGRIERALAVPCVLDGNEVFVTASLGIALYPRDGSDADTLLRHADAAMYAAKCRGRGTFEEYSPTLTEQARRRLALEADLRQAIRQGELEVHYQPRLSAGGVPLGAEALLRWRHPVRGLVPPGEFIPMAEETGLILQVGDTVLAKACAACASWQAARPGFVVSVNISPRQLREPDFVDGIRRALRVSGLPGSCLELEITEGVLMEDTPRCEALLREVRELGVRVALDDFGTGYSSLSYLKRFSLDTLKIDRSFIADLPDDAEATAITRAIVAISRSLRLTVVAEGVEDLQQLQFLRENGCDEVQGFHYAAAMPEQDLEEWLDRHEAGIPGRRLRLVSGG